MDISSDQQALIFQMRKPFVRKRIARRAVIPKVCNTLRIERRKQEDTATRSHMVQPTQHHS